MMSTARGIVIEFTNTSLPTYFVFLTNAPRLILCRLIICLKRNIYIINFVLPKQHYVKK